MTDLVSITKGVAVRMEITPLDAMLRCTSRLALKRVWLYALTDEDRAELRPNAQLSAHVWSVLKRDPA